MEARIASADRNGDTRTPPQVWPVLEYVVVDVVLELIGSDPPGGATVMRTGQQAQAATLHRNVDQRDPAGHP
jgi:hypothetical protein